MIWLDSRFSEQLEPVWQSVDDALATRGQVYRESMSTGRRTLRFEVKGRGYFMKQHRGVGWREIFKNLLSFRRPVLGARNEWQAIVRLSGLGVDTMQLVGYGREGWNPARQRSFVLTRELLNTVSLEEYCGDWLTDRPAFRTKQQLINRVADMVRSLHENGINHRDLYICHFLLQLPWQDKARAPTLYLIDLHRAQIHSSLPVRKQVKDLGALYFSALGIGLTRRDLYRFMCRYTQRSLRDTLARDPGLWRAVVLRCERMRGRKFKS